MRGVALSRSAHAIAADNISRHGINLRVPELMTTRGLAWRQQWVIQPFDLSIGQGNKSVAHPGSCWQRTDHRMFCAFDIHYSLGQVHKAPTFRVNLPTCCDKGPHSTARVDVSSELYSVKLGVTASEVET